MVAIGKLKPNPKNPNKHPEAQIEALAKLIRHLGWRAPVTVSNRSGLVVRGHGRLMAAERLGLETVPVDYQDYASEADEWTDLLADNRIPEFAAMDDELTAKLLSDLEKIADDIEITGYTQKDLQKMIRANEKKNQNEAGEVEFTEELHESSNYVVLYFNNDIDWLNAMSLFDLKTVKALHSKPGFEGRGIGRVLDGPKAINKILAGSRR
jgi:ParB-like chromosome segregation protein Spo0J